MSIEFAAADSPVPDLAKRLSRFPEIRRRINENRAARGLPLIPRYRARLDPVAAEEAAAALARLKAALAASR